MRLYLYICLLPILSLISAPVFAFAGEPGMVDGPKTHKPRRVFPPASSTGLAPIMSKIVIAPPETATPVKLSSTDVNRIVCSDGNIKDVVYSKEKGIDVKIAGPNAFIKFLVKINPGGDEEYSTTPTEFFVVCSGNVYTLVAAPLRIPSQTVRLSSGRKTRIKQNLSAWRSLPFEKKVMTIIKSMYTGDIPDTWLVKTPTEKPVDNITNGIRLSLTRTVNVEGEGLRGKEYLITLADETSLTLAETMFLKHTLTSKPIAVSIDKHLLNQRGDTARLFIVERSLEASP